MLRFADITLTYPGARRPALSGLDLTVSPGSSVAVLGGNGSGKSTLARLANGILLPGSGTVTVDGLDTADADSIGDVRRRVGLVFQNPDDQIVATVVEEDVAFGPENLGLPPAEIRVRVDEALAAVGLTGLERREPHLLSGGQKQRLAIAGALAMHPRYLVLDEPTSMLDPEGRADVLAVIERLEAAGTGIVHITHHLADAVRADRVLVLDGGETVFSGSLSGLLARGEALSDWGLSLPPIWRLADELRRGGIDIPVDAMDAESVVNALCR